MAEQTIHNNVFSTTNTNNFWLTRPPPNFISSQPMPPINNYNYRMPCIYPPVSLSNQPMQINTNLPYSCNLNNLNYQNQYTPYNQSIRNSFPPLPDNIDKEYILSYLCTSPKVLKDTTSGWIENWLATKVKIIKTQNVKTANVKINEISNSVKECKQLLENLNNCRQLMEQNISAMTKIEWEYACSNLFTLKEQIDTIIKTLNLDNNSMSELKFKLIKRKNKRNRLKRLKSDLKIIKSQKEDEIKEKDKKIENWQNALKENIIKEKRVYETKIEANIFLKGIRGKIEDAKNQLKLLDTLEKLRKCRLQNCINKRKNPLLEESLNKLKILWQHKLTNYNKEEEDLKSMLSKAEIEKHEKKEIEIQEKIKEWNKILFGPDFRSHEVVFDNLSTFLDIRKGWDKYVINDNNISASSHIPVGWIMPLIPCNSDWAKYSNKCINMSEK